jgi:hypothetical protein
VSVNATVDDFDTQTVLCIRTCACPCRPETQMRVDDFRVAMHELDLVRLADLSDLPLERACGHCGRETSAQFRAAAVVPAERSLRALVHLRFAGGEQAYALVAHGDSDDPQETAEAIFGNFSDPERRQQVAPDEAELVEQWGRPLSTVALVRASFADFLTSGDAARIVHLSDSVAYEFARRDDDVPSAADIADTLARQWGVDVDAVLFFSAERGLGQPGTLVECLGPVRAGMDTAAITCIANLVAFERQTREALDDCGLTYLEANDDPEERLLRITEGGHEATIAIGDVARSALLYGRTTAEAADLEAQRLKLAFAYFHTATADGWDGTLPDLSKRWHSDHGWYRNQS